MGTVVVAGQSFADDLQDTLRLSARQAEFELPACLSRIYGN
jgi:hypothetical protein